MILDARVMPPTTDVDLARLLLKGGRQAGGKRMIPAARDASHVPGHIAARRVGAMGR
jgi:hypothetical protein